MKQYDITHQLITADSIHQNLTSIFTDAIIVEDNFSIAGISDSILRIIGFELHELQGKSLDFLSTSDSLQIALRNELKNGFSDQGVLTGIRTKHFGLISCQITGFYLGLISDLSGYIVLRVKQIDEINRLNEQLQSSRKELDEFVYRSAHDLRGPLATIRGLVNLMKLKPSEDEMNLLVEMIESSASKMDDRLFGLHYLAESSRVEAEVGELNCYALETSLRATLEAHCPFNNVDFQFNTPITLFNGSRPQSVISLVNNILLYLLALPTSGESTLTFSLRELDNGLAVDIHAEGFTGSYQLMQAMRQKSAIYSKAVTYSQLIHYYAAQKIAQLLNATMQVNFAEEDVQHIFVLVPAGEL